MKPLQLICTLTLPALLAAAAGESAPLAKPADAPPVAPARPHQVPSPNGARDDPYYWLRDDERKNPEMLAYLAAENAYYEKQMAPLGPLEDKLFAEITGRIKQDDSSVPFKRRGYWYYTRFETGGEYPIFARRKGAMEAPEEVMLDVNKMAQGKGFYQVAGYHVSPDNRLLAYVEDAVGRRQYTLRVKSLVTGGMLKDEIRNVQGDLAWLDDNRTFLYTEKDPVTLLGMRIKRHRLGTDPAADPLVYEEKDHSFYINVDRSRSERFIYISAGSTQVSETRYAPANGTPLKFKTVLPREANHEYEVEDHGNEFIIRTNWHAVNFRIVRAPMTASRDKRVWRDVIPHRGDAFVEGFEVYNGHLVVNERSGGLLKIRVKPWKSGARDFIIAADEPAYTASLAGTPDPASPAVRYVYTSLTTPRSTYDYDMTTGEKILRKRDPVLGGFDPANYETEYLHIAARDGTPVPVSLYHRKGFKPDGAAPLLLNGYGSYGLSSDPEFDSRSLSLVDRGFVYAIAHVRGGQEMGRRWYEDGRQHAKMHTFTDFIDVARGLVARGYAAKDKVFATGASAGGLLMGATANLAPGDFRGIVAHVPFVDVVTTMLDDSIPLTTNEYDEWGDPRRKPDYDYMLSYSPYDNVSAQDYPAMLVTTGLWDSQVQYYEPAKWVAKLRALKTDRNPLLFHINMEAGHGGKSGRFQRHREVAEEYAFILGRLGVTQ